MTGAKKQNKYAPSTQDYRKLEGLNNSMLKKFDDDPMVFFQEFIMGWPKQEKESNALTIGQLVDFILLDCGGDEELFTQRMSEKFGVFDGIKSTAQAFLLADELFIFTQRDRAEDGTITSSFEDRFREAFAAVQAQDKYKGKTWEKGLEDFNKTAKEYFDSKMYNLGKTIVDLWQIEKSKSICSQARGDEFQGEIVNMQSSDDVEVIDKLQIEFKYKEWSCKMEQDRTLVDHNKKIIRRLDYKTAFDNEEFAYSYIKRKYYLQNGFYHAGTKNWANKNGLKEYDVQPMEFLAFDTSVNNRRPLLYKTTEEMVDEAMFGFRSKGGRYYRGIEDLIDEITWANENGIWNISKENYDNKGIVELKPYNELQPEDK